jgi:hypothetical protein
VGGDGGAGRKYFAEFQPDRIGWPGAAEKGGKGMAISDRSGFSTMVRAVLGGLLVAAMVVMAQAAAAQKAAEKGPTGATIGGFSVYGRSDIRQGMSRDQIVELLKFNTYRCAQELVPSSHDANIYALNICGKPELYLSFCKDSLYWASVTKKGGFATFIRLLRTYASNRSRNSRFKPSDFTALSRARSGDEIVQDYEFSLQITAQKYNVTITMFGKPGDVEGVARDIRMDYQALIDSADCR